MQLEPLNFSKIYSDQIDRNQISPGRKRSRNYNSRSILSSNFFNENVQLEKENDQLVRPRSNDIFVEEKTIINPTTSFSSSDDLSSSEKPLKKVVSWTNDLKEPTNALNKYDDNLVPVKSRSHQGTLRKRSVSLSEIKSVKTAASAAFPQTEEKIEKTKSKNMFERLSPRKSKQLSPRDLFSNNEKLKIIDALKKNGLPDKNPDANRLLSFELGKIILQTENDLNQVENFIQYGITNPKVCGEEMWRSMGCTKLFHHASLKPLVDGTFGVLDDDTRDMCFQNDEEKDAYYSISMKNMLNLFFQHVSKSNQVLINPVDFDYSQHYAGQIGLSIAELLKAEEDKGMDPAITKTMQLMLGLGKQELYTHPATWTIPTEYHTVSGTDNLIITEYGPTFAEKLKPLQCNREISIYLKKDGGLDYITEQPITFKERASNDLLGTCRMKTTFVFDHNMNFFSKTHETKAAEIIHS